MFYNYCLSVRPMLWPLNCGIRFPLALFPSLMIRVLLATCLTYLSSRHGWVPFSVLHHPMLCNQINICLTVKLCLDKSDMNSLLHFILLLLSSLDSVLWFVFCFIFTLKWLSLLRIAICTVLQPLRCKEMQKWEL